MAQFVWKGISLDEDTAKLLKNIAEREAEGETPNESRAIRRMIREKAQELGIVVSNEKKPRREKVVAA